MEQSGRLTIPIAMAITLGGIVATASVSWGVQSARTNSIDTMQREQGSLLQQHDRQITEVRAQYTEILRRLERIDRKLEQQP